MKHVIPVCASAYTRLQVQVTSIAATMAHVCEHAARKLYICLSFCVIYACIHMADQAAALHGRCRLTCFAELRLQIVAAAPLAGLCMTDPQHR